MRKAILTFFLLLMFSLINNSQIFASDSNSETAPEIKVVLNDLSVLEDKITSLAEAIPAEKYSWRPEEGVRSVSELFVHVSSANYFISSLMGAKMPEGLSRDAEKTMTDKSEIQKLLKDSFKFVKEFISSYDTSKLETVVKTPFGEMTNRDLLLLVTSHPHEHLGQAIAYARVNGVVPPWSKKSE
jgi:uncharacterized damage-inducible protein DinB